MALSKARQGSSRAGTEAMSGGSRGDAAGGGKGAEDGEWLQREFMSGCALLDHMGQVCVRVCVCLCVCCVLRVSLYTVIVDIMS